MTVDLRSDTVTLPTDKMLSNMVEADVGDDGRTRRDGRSEDPTVRKLEDRSTELAGKQAAIFVPSGTFGNTLGALALSQGSSPIWVYERAHILASEKALFSDDLFGRELRTYRDLAEVPPVAKSEQNSLLLVENTVSSDAGRPLGAAELQQLDQLKQAGWLIHMDGARLFNAAVESATSVEKHRLVV
jgi:threonine aldolase